MARSVSNSFRAPIFAAEAVAKFLGQQQAEQITVVAVVAMPGLTSIEGEAIGERIAGGGFNQAVGSVDSVGQDLR